MQAEKHKVSIKTTADDSSIPYSVASLATSVSDSWYCADWLTVMDRTEHCL